MFIDQIQKDFLTNKMDKNTYKRKMYDFYINLGKFASLIPQSDVKSIHIENGEIVSEILNGRFPNLKLYFNFLDLGSPVAEIINFGHFEKDYSTKLMEALQSTDIFFDIGANVGYYSLIGALRNKKTKVYAFEPVPQTYEKLLKNISLNSVQNISSFNFGFLEKKKDICVFFDSYETTAASLKNIRETEKAQRTVCNFLTLDSFVEEHRIIPDLIKIDVEGSELYTLAGAVKTLRSAAPIIFVEVLRKWCAKFGHSAMDVFSLLYNLGYSSYVVRGSKLEEILCIDENTIDSNFIFKKRFI